MIFFPQIRKSQSQDFGICSFSILCVWISYNSHREIYSYEAAYAAREFVIEHHLQGVDLRAFFPGWFDRCLRAKVIMVLLIDFRFLYCFVFFFFVLPKHTPLRKHFPSDFSAFPKKQFKTCVMLPILYYLVQRPCKPTQSLIVANKEGKASQKSRISTNHWEINQSESMNYFLLL